MTSKYPHRTGTKAVQFIDSNGLPLNGANVTVRQTETAVKFGCAGFEAIQTVNGLLEGDEKISADRRISFMLEIFNFITLPFYWGRFEPEQGKPVTDITLKAAKWLTELNMLVKGHPLCWHTSCADWLMEFSDEEILRLQLERINRDVTDFKGYIDTWDVINEVVIMPIYDRYDNAVTRICKREGQVGLVKKLFDEARRANFDSTLLINDFDMSTDYSDLITKLLDAGVCIDAIGLQSHMHQGCWHPEKTEEILERFSKFGLPLHFTEINLVSGDLMPAHIGDLNDFIPDDWPTTPEGEERQAKELIDFYKLLYKYPLVEAFTYWSFTDGGWLNAPCGLVTRDARKKPAYDALYDLIHNQWRTPDMTLRTDENGYIEVTGFCGEYVAKWRTVEVEFSI